MSGARPTVLVVDDSAADRELVASLLGANFRVVTAADVPSGLAAYEREHPDCVLLDYQLPGIDGLDGVTEFVHRNAVVIMMSGASGEELAAEAISRGARDFIPKNSLTGPILSRMITRERERRRLELELRLAQKLEAIGQLAAGVAHEINTPAQYVSDNVTFLAEGLRDALPLLTACAALGRDDAAVDIAELRRLARQADIDFLAAELPIALQQTAAGIAQIRKIVAAMKELSHPSDDVQVIDLNHAIETTVTVSKNEWKYVADVELALSPDVPPVSCCASEINQVLLNLIVNAAHAIEAKGARGGDAKGTITISSRVDGPYVAIGVADTGCGIPNAIRDRIYDPFFTTKQIGKGTGQGLAIAHRIVKDRHGGTIDFESTVGRGTRFTIRLPIVGPPTRADVADATDHARRRAS